MVFVEVILTITALLGAICLCKSMSQSHQLVLSALRELAERVSFETSWAANPTYEEKCSYSLAKFDYLR